MKFPWKKGFFLKWKTRISHLWCELRHGGPRNGSQFAYWRRRSGKCCDVMWHHYCFGDLHQLLSAQLFQYQEDTRGERGNFPWQGCRHIVSCVIAKFWIPRKRWTESNRLERCFTTSPRLSSRFIFVHTTIVQVSFWTRSLQIPLIGRNSLSSRYLHYENRQILMQQNKTTNVKSFGLKIFQSKYWLNFSHIVLLTHYRPNAVRKQKTLF